MSETANVRVQGKGPFSVTALRGWETAGEVAAIHEAALPGGFMAALGKPFLRCVIANVATSKHGIALVATSSSGRPVGFLLATTSARLLYRDFLVRYALLAAVVSFPRFLRPSVLFRSFETLLYPRKVTDPTWPTAELLDLAVDESARGQGVASALFHSLVTEFSHRDVASFKILTGEALTGAHKFYDKQGAVHIGDCEVHAGASTRVYAYSRPGERPSLQQGVEVHPAGERED